MKLNSWSRLALLVVVAVAIAMTAAIDDGGATVKPTETPLPLAAGAGQEATGPKQTVTGQNLALRVELERMVRHPPGQDAVQQDAAEEKTSGIFSVTSWYVPPPPPPKPIALPPPMPTAPPMPFSYLGRYQESQAVVIMLVKGDRIYTVSAGDVIENIYRVEGMTDGGVEVTYLPLNIKQTIDTGEAS